MIDLGTIVTVTIMGVCLFTIGYIWGIAKQKVGDKEK